MMYVGDRQHAQRKQALHNRLEPVAIALNGGYRREPGALQLAQRADGEVVARRDAEGVPVRGEGGTCSARYSARIAEWQGFAILISKHQHERGQVVHDVGHELDDPSGAVRLFSGSLPPYAKRARHSASESRPGESASVSSGSGLVR